MAEQLRDPLVLTYEALKHAIRQVHGEKFLVYDDIPVATELKKQLPAANLSYVSGVGEKAFMREFDPHTLKDNENGTFTVVTETLRFDYYIQVSFFATKKGLAQMLSNKFMAIIELENEILIPNDPWGETMQIMLESPPLPPRGEPDLYQCEQTWLCRGKLLTTEVVNAVDITNLRIRTKNV